MRRGMFLAAIAALSLGVCGALAQQTVTRVGDPAPWHLSKVSKLTRARGGSEVPATSVDSHPYLHISVDFKTPAEAREKQDFRIVDQRGKEVGELWGWNDGRSLVIFEGSWADLRGLWLDGKGHREPLFATALVATRPVTPQIAHTRPIEPARTLVTGRSSVYVAPNTTY
ncbi:MAG TPA: hypothetical protein VE890_06920, partial [Thermoguttaceae bacterium]|nr:hypothetical protein [Thermoguttaceae bacterium]